MLRRVTRRYCTCITHYCTAGSRRCETEIPRGPRGEGVGKAHDRGVGIWEGGGGWRGRVQDLADKVERRWVSIYIHLRTVCM